MAKVSLAYALDTSGIGLGQPIIIQGGADGKYGVLAHQIDWGKSQFNKQECRTSEELLTAIENAIEQNSGFNTANDLWDTYSKSDNGSTPGGNHGSNPGPNPDISEPSVSPTPTDTPTATPTVSPS
jgi:hypothetical protein